MGNCWPSDPARYRKPGHLALIGCALAALACRATRPLPRCSGTPASRDGRACFDFGLLGITCLGGSGWQNYAQSKFSPPRYISKMDTCADGQIVAVGISNLAVWDDRTWSERAFRHRRPAGRALLRHLAGGRAVLVEAGQETHVTLR